MVLYLLPRASDKKLDWPDAPPKLVKEDLEDHSFAAWIRFAFPVHDRADQRMQDRFVELAVYQISRFRPLSLGFALTYYLKEMSLAAQAELWNKTLVSAGYDLGDTDEGD